MQTTEGRSSDGQIDWEAIEHSEEFQELIRRKRRFVVPATVFFLAWYLGFVLLAGYAEDFMAESIYEGLTVGYVLALTQFLMVWVLAWLYLRKADREFDPLERKAVDHLRQEFDPAVAGDRTGAGRFGRTGEGAADDAGGAGAEPGGPASPTGPSGTEPRR